MITHHEGNYEIATLDAGSISVRYSGTIKIVMLRKIRTLGNAYALSTNFSDFKKSKVTKHEGLRLAKELLLANDLESKGRVLL